MRLMLLVVVVCLAGVARGDELADLRKEVAELRAENVRLKAATRPAVAKAPRKWFYVYAKESNGETVGTLITADFKLDAVNKAKSRGMKDPSARDATRSEVAEAEADEAKRAAQPGIMDPSKRIKVGNTLDEAIAILGPTEHEERNADGTTSVWWRVYAPIISTSGTFSSAGATGLGGRGGSGGGSRTVLSQVQAEFDAKGVATEVIDNRK